MKTLNTAAALTASVALLAAPAAGFAAGKSDGKGKSGSAPGQVKPKGTTGPTGPKTTPDGSYTIPKGEAYGVKCKGFSKKKAEGQKKSPFALCVTAMAKLDKGTSKKTAKACAGLSKKKPKAVKGKSNKGKSDYAKCKSAGAKLLKEKKALKAVA